MCDMLNTNKPRKGAAERLYMKAVLSALPASALLHSGGVGCTTDNVPPIIRENYR